MAYTGISPVLTVVQESQDAMQLKIWDWSTWGAGDVAATDTAVLSISYYDTNGDLVEFDDYEVLSSGGDRTDFNDMLDHTAGLIIELTDLEIDGAAPDIT